MDVGARLASNVPSFVFCRLMPGGTDIFEVQGWQPQGPGRQPMVNLPIWPTESPPRLIGQIARCSQTPVVMWQRPSEKSDNVCKLLMLHVAGAPIGRGTERLQGSRKGKFRFRKVFPGHVLDFQHWKNKFLKQLLQCTQNQADTGMQHFHHAVIY